MFMPIDFTYERWEKVRENARLWWSGQLGRPLLHITVHGKKPTRPPPRLPCVARDKTSYDLSVSPEEIVDRWDYELSCKEYLGDSFPCVWVDFGAGVLSAFLGANAQPSNGTVWFHPSTVQEINKLHFEYNPENVWLKRIKAICKTAIERWNGLVQIGMTDLGGTLDILSTFRPGEKLLIDLIDSPDEVKRLIWEIHRVWWKCFEDINTILRPKNPGYTAWTPIFSEAPYYMLQCDFCYMVGPLMFDEFVKPELVQSCRKLTNPFYHLDGMGQLIHLDLLLSIKELKGIQWVPGTGKPPPEEWKEVYQKIQKAGKLIHFTGDWQNFDRLVSKLGSAEGFILFGSISQEQRYKAEEFLKRYGAN